MKRFFSILSLVLIAALCFCPLADAKKIAKYRLLEDAAGTSISDYALTAATAVYSESIKIYDNVGFSTLLITEDIAGGAGDVDISVQYSVDGSNWYTAYTTDMAGIIIAEGNLVTALQNVTRWIPHSVRLSVWMRYMFDPDANSQITAYNIYQWEN